MVFITDATQKKEITSYVRGKHGKSVDLVAAPVQVDTVPVTADDEYEHHRCARALRAGPSTCKSHTVLVVDQSGSMRTSDVARFLTRSDAVFATLALDFIGRQIDAGQASVTDAVSLVVMRDDATVEFEREPLTNVLFNDVVARIGRYGDAGPRGHGNYVPALEAAAELFEGDTGNGTVTLTLMFLSDGRPSDGRTAGIPDAIAALAARFRSQFIACMIGFSGAEGEDFSVMKAMASAAVAGGSHGNFVHVGTGDAAATLSNAITSVVARLSATRTQLTQLIDGLSLRRTERDVPREAPLDRSSNAVSRDGWFVYTGSDFVGRWVWHGSNGRRGGRWVETPLREARARGLAIRKRAFGSGAERVVYQCREIPALTGAAALTGATTAVGDWLVAKESRFAEDEALKLVFHEAFCETQQTAADVAAAFNARLSSWSCPIARVEFLECSVYVVNEADGREAGYLVERMLVPALYKKWNGNAGFVADGRGAGPLAALLGPVRRPLANIVEGESEDEEDEDDEDEAAPRAAASRVLTTQPTDFVLAFSHFSYVHSRRKLLVCDLQGQLEAAHVLSDGPRHTLRVAPPHGRVRAHRPRPQGHR